MTIVAPKAQNPFPSIAIFIKLGSVCLSVYIYIYPFTFPSEDDSIYANCPIYKEQSLYFLGNCPTECTISMLCLFLSLGDAFEKAVRFSC